MTSLAFVFGVMPLLLQLEQGRKPCSTGSCRSIWYGAEHIARHSLYPEFLRIDAEVAGEVQ